MASAQPKHVSQDGKGKPRKHFVLDTSVLLHNPDAIFKFQEHEVVIPLVVIEELDQFKLQNDERGRNARDVIRNIDRLRSKGNLSDGVVWNAVGGSLRIAVDGEKIPPTLDSHKPGNRIIAVAAALHQSGARTTFVSNDINARVKCDALGIPAEDFLAEKVDAAWLYDGWSDVTVPGDLIDELYDERQLPASKLSDYLVRTREDGTHQPIVIHPNHYLVLHDIGDTTHTGLARLLADTDHFIPVTGPRRPIFGIMPRNAQQIMALDLLLDDEVKLVTLLGSAGTGKTLLAVAAGMMKVYQEKRFDKLLAARPIMPLGRDIGYLPGTKDEKLSLWMQPIFDNLAYLLSTRGTHLNEPDSQSLEKRIEALIEEGKLVIEPITYIRGRSIPNQYMIVDEVQNLSPHEVKTIVSRVGEGTKIILTGDVNQIDNPYLDASSNGLSYVVEHMKSQRLSGHITLKKSERSELASLAAELL
jgi:PhoH-like ATPase